MKGQKIVAVMVAADEGTILLMHEMSGSSWRIQGDVKTRKVGSLLYRNKFNKEWKQQIILGRDINPIIKLSKTKKRPQQMPKEVL